MMQPILLKIAIISINDAIKNRIMYLLEFIEQSIELQNYASISEIKEKFVDIVIFDKLEKNEINKCPKSLERIVLIDDFNEEVSEILDGFTAIWPKNISDSLLNFHLKSLLTNVTNQRKQTLNSIYLDTLINSVPDLIWFKDIRGSHLKVNDSFGRAVGKSKEDCEGRGHYYIWDLEPEDYATGEYVCLETEEEVLRKKETCLFDEKVKSKSGMRQFKTYKSPLFDLNGELFGTVGIAKDVTDLQNISRELEVIIASIPFGTLIVDDAGSIIHYNTKFSEYFLLDKNSISSMNFVDVCRNIFEIDSKVLGNQKPLEIINKRNGNHQILCLQSQDILDIFGNIVGMFLICIDITTEYELRQKITRSANTDFLTGLYNRRYFYDVIYEKSKQMPIHIIYLDLDNFKQVNDTFGHQAGDRALITFGNLLQTTFENDIIVRLGGDEFAVALLGKKNRSSLTQELDVFMNKTIAVFHSHPQFHKLSISAGIALNQQGNIDIDTLISQADHSLYEAKDKGKAQYVIYQ